MIVQLLDEPHIGGGNSVPYLVARKCQTFRMLAKGFDYGVRALPLRLAAHGRLHIGLGKHRVIRRGGDVWPMWLDVGDMEAPRCVALLAHEVNRAVSGPSSF